MPDVKQFRTRISGSGTVTLISRSCGIKEIVIAPNASGWSLSIQDKAGSPFVVIPQFSLTVPTNGAPTVVKFDNPVFMQGGIDVVPTGTVSGSCSVWVTVQLGPVIPT